MKNKPLIKNELPISLTLLSLLWVTRSGVVGSHFGSALNLPDASWAVFWLLGFWTRRVHWLAVAFIASMTADYFAVKHGTRTDCFTPAYIFLLPAYLSLWGAGRWAQHRLTSNVKCWPMVSLSVIAGVLACFICSNIGMYIASDTVNSLSAWEYMLAIAHYLPLYLATTSMYVGTGGLIAYVIKQIPLLTHSNQRA